MRRKMSRRRISSDQVHAATATPTVAEARGLMSCWGALEDARIVTNGEHPLDVEVPAHHRALSEHLERTEPELWSWFRESLQPSEAEIDALGRHLILSFAEKVPAKLKDAVQVA